jgi:hypothetical protein
LGHSDGTLGVVAQGQTRHPESVAPGANGAQTPSPRAFSQTPSYRT